MFLSMHGRDHSTPCSEELQEKQVIPTQKQYPLSLALAFLPGTKGIEIRGAILQTS